MMKRLICLPIILLFVFVNCFFVSAITGSIGNARMVLYPEVNGWTYTTIEKSILVKNVNDIPVNVKLATDEDSARFLEIIDNEFVLQPGEEKRAEFIVKVKKEGTYEGRINIFFSVLEDSGTKEPGVVLSSTIIAIAKKSGDYDESDDVQDDDEDTDGVNVGLGKVIDENNQTNKGIIFLGASSFILLIILAGLMTVMVKKGKMKNKNIKKGVKRSVKLNDKGKI